VIRIVVSRKDSVAFGCNTSGLTITNECRELSQQGAQLRA